MLEGHKDKTDTVSPQEVVKEKYTRNQKQRKAHVGDLVISEH